MKQRSHFSEPKLVNELIKEVSEINEFIRNSYSVILPLVDPGNGSAGRNTSLMRMTGDLLDESDFNIRARGYTFISDAICYISEKKCSSVSLHNDVYPYIAEKHGIESLGLIEHSIRNSINSAYKSYIQAGGGADHFMSRFRSKPSNKEFLLHSVREMDLRMAELKI